MGKIIIKRNKNFFEELCAEILSAPAPDYKGEHYCHSISYATIYVKGAYIDGLYGLEPKKYDVYASYYYYKFGIYDDFGVSASKEYIEGYDRYYYVWKDPIIAKVIKPYKVGSNFKEIKKFITKECELLLAEVEKEIIKKEKEDKKWHM